MSMNYTTFVQRLFDQMDWLKADVNANIIVPTVIDFAEQRIYRELDLIATVIRDSSGQLTANSRNFTLPTASGRFVVVQTINVYSPSGAVSTSSARNPLQPVDYKLLDFVAPKDIAPTTPSVPAFFTMVTDQTILVGPAPDAAYFVEVVGTIRPTPLSSANTTTFLTNYLPDLFLAAAMVEAASYALDSAAPRVALLEEEYVRLRASAMNEETKRRYNQTYTVPPKPPTMNTGAASPAA